jgi:PAS domain S-box-containing protein
MCNNTLISSNGHPRNRDEIGTMTVRERELLTEAEAAKKQLEMVVNSVSDMFLMLDRDLRYTYVNERMLQASGMAREQIEGRLLTEVFPDTAGTLLETELRRVVEQQVPVKFEYFHESYDRWFENRAYPIPTGLMLLTTEITEQKKAAEVLRASEERFRALINCMHQQVWINDPEGRAVYVNDRWCEYISGLPGNQDRNWGEFIHPEDLSAIYKIRSESMAAGRPYELQYRLKKHNGEYRWHVARVVPHRRADGSVEYWIGTATDIHDFKTAQEQLKRSEEQFRMLVVTSSQCVWRHSVDQTKQAELQPEAERWWEELTGQTQKQAQGWGWLEVVHPEDKERVRKDFERALQEGQDYIIEYRVCRKDGQWRWLAVRGIPFRDKNGVLQEWAGTMSDITEQRLAENALRETEARQRAILEHMPVGVWFINQEGKIIYGNPAGKEIWRGARYVGVDEFHEYKAWRHGVDQRIGAEDWGGARCLRTGQIILDEIVDVECFDGSRKVLSNSTVPIMEDGKVVAVVVLNNDITERIRAEEALKESQELLHSRAKHLEKLVQERTAKLQEMIGDLEAFSYSISHDLRAPLRSMQGFAQALQEDCGKIIGPEGNEYIRRIASAASRMDRLIQDVLTFSRVSQVKMDMEVVDVEKLIHGIVETYPNLQLSMAEIAIDGPVPKMMGNEAALTQCISNLLGNAVKFVKPGTKAKVRIRAERKNDVVRLWFEDNGIGIRKNAQEKIFGIFQKLNKDYEGTGIGLAIVRKAAERMNGRVGVESQLGTGSQFWLELQRGE